jgi:hypothetical protein
MFRPKPVIVSCAASALAVCVFVACGDDPQGAAPTPTDGGSDAVPPAPQVPSSIDFRDSDPAQGSVRGTVTVGRAFDETDIADYKLFWANEANQRSTLIVSWNTASSPAGPLSFDLSGPVPPSQTRLLAISDSPGALFVPGVSIGPADNFPRYLNVEANQPATNAYRPAAMAFDAKNKQLFMVATHVGVDGLTLFRCSNDIRECAFGPIAGVVGNYAGVRLSAVVDTVHDRLWVVGPNPQTQMLGASRCDLDGNGCAYLDLGAGAGVKSGYEPAAIVDPGGGALLVAAARSTPAMTTGLYRCKLDGDGSDCEYADISAGKPSDYPSVAVDTTTRTLFVAVTGADGKAGLLRSGLDGTGPSYVDISAGQDANSALTPSIVLDDEAHQLMVVATNNGQGSRPWLYRCDWAGAGCTASDISTGVAESGVRPSAFLDAARNLYVVAKKTAPSSQGAPSFVRCGPLGTACASIDIAGTRTTSDAWFPAVLDGKRRRVFMGAGDKPGVFYLDTW